VPAPPRYANVAPPPAPPKIVATPAQLVEATKLELEITTQAAVLDMASDTFNKAHVASQAAASLVADAQAKLAVAEANHILAQIDVTNAQSALRVTALSAYVDLKPVAPPPSTDSLDAIYQAGLAGAYGRSAAGTATDRIHAFQAAERRMRSVSLQVEAVAKQAGGVSDAAQAAERSAQAAAVAANAQQQKLVATLAKVQGNLIALVGAQRAAMAVQAYEQLSKTTSKSLDFQTPFPLPTQLPETAAALQLVLAQVGKPYVWGATGPNTFDCSGLMQWTWEQLGVRMPRVAADQQAWAVPVPISQLLPGDLVFFGSSAHHVGMYVGNGMMVNAPHTGAFVEVAPIWWSDLAGFGRVHR
jgi:cell wall-associated NlpC family hydrolase